MFRCFLTDEVTMIEAILTFVFFPTLLVSSYYIDKYETRMSSEAAHQADDSTGGWIGGKDAKETQGRLSVRDLLLLAACLLDAAVACSPDLGLIVRIAALRVMNSHGEVLTNRNEISAILQSAGGNSQDAAKALMKLIPPPPISRMQVGASPIIVHAYVTVFYFVCSPLLNCQSSPCLPHNTGADQRCQGHDGQALPRFSGRGGARRS